MKKKESIETPKQKLNNLELILSTLDTGLSVINADHTISWANDKIYEMFPGTDPIGQICHRFYESSDEPCEPCPTFQCFKSGHVEEVERFNPTNKRWYRIISQPIKGPVGQVLSVLEGVTDITESKQAEKSLIESEKRYRSLFEFMEEGLLRADTNGHITLANRAIAKMCGYESPEEMIGLHMSEIYADPNDREKMIQTVRAKGILHNYEILLKRKDGHYFASLSNIKVIKDEHGEIIGTEGLVRDVTERKQAEDAIINQNYYLEKSQELGQIGTWELDLINDILLWTDENCRIFGVPEGSVVDYETFLSKVHPEDREYVDREWKAAIDGKPYDIEHRLLLNGEVRWVREKADLNFDDNGNVVSAIGFTQDITERKQAENVQAETQVELVQRNKFIEMIMDMLPIGIGVNYIDSGEVTYLNKKFVEIYGWSKPDFPNVHDFFEKVFPDPKKRQILKEQIMGDIASGDPDRMIWENLEITTNKGEKRIVTAINIPIFSQNIMISTVQDFTEKTKLEAQLNHAQRMDSIGRLAGGVAHDFNNMLSVILGHAEMALDQIEESSPLSNDLVEIQSAAKRSAELTRQLLAFARRQTISPQNLDLNATVESMLRMLGRLIGEDIDLSWLPGNNLDAVKMDPSQLDQLLANLCVNARDAIKGIGKVTIETCNVSFDQNYCDDHLGFKPGDYVCLTVSDNGCGMDKDTCANIFEPFFTTKKTGEGTGLGLATVYGIVKQNDGFINVYSELGEGTTFRIYLPSHESLSGKKGGSKKNMITEGSGETILLVEDEAAIMRMGKTMLERLGYMVLSSDNPMDALKVAKEYPGEIHVLITDVVMPEMNGRDLAESLQASKPALKILYMSGYTANVIAHHGTLDDGVHFLQKPFSQAQIASAIKGVLETDKD